MSIRNGLVTLLLLTGLTACGDTLQTIGTLAAGPAIDLTRDNSTGGDAAFTSVAVTSVEIVVPQSLTVSEANVLVPMSDIVWRGDPLGDRRAQVAAIILDAANTATSGMVEGRGVVLRLEVVRFHALTEKARYLIGGNYALRFLMTLRDAETGTVIDGPRPLDADLRASGGVRAIAEENAGRTEKVVITERLAEVITYELTHLVLQ